MSKKRNRDDVSESIKVVVRCRPIAQSELDKGYTQIIDMDRNLSAVRVSKPKSEGGSEDEIPRSFTYDFVYSPNISQTTLFNETAKPIVDSVLNGYNGTIFAYGQTGTGKTFTMEGVISNPELRGIMPNSFQYIFDAVNNAPLNVNFLVRASFLEIYMDEIYDLLSKSGARTKMELKMDADKGVIVKDLTNDIVKSPEDLFNLLSEGQKQRRVGETAMNKGSSRSHSIFTIIVETSSTDPETGATLYKQGKLNLVDLAGSERQKKTGAEGERMEEAKFINLSLSALGNVIKALASPNVQHVPFRDSKLTRLLEDSLGGNTKTVMMANIGPADSNFSETMSTLRYADRAKHIKNKPKVNEDPKDASLRAMQEEIAMLKAQLLAKQRGIDLTKLSKEQIVALGSTGANPEGIETEVVRVTVVDTGYRMEDLNRKMDEMKLEAESMANKTEAEKAELLKRQKIAEDDFKRLESELLSNQERVKEEEAETKKYQELLAQRQEELMQGGGHVEVAERNRVALIEAEEELKKKREDQERINKEMAEKEEQRLLAQDTYANVEQELQATHKKLRALFSKFQEKKEDLKQAIDEFDQERSDLLDSIHALDRQIKLRSLMIESFMPFSFYQVVDKARRWDAFNEQWVLPGLELSGNSLGGTETELETNHPLYKQYIRVGSVADKENVYLNYPPQ